MSMQTPDESDHHTGVETDHHVLGEDLATPPNYQVTWEGAPFVFECMFEGIDVGPVEWDGMLYWVGPNTWQGVTSGIGSSHCGTIVTLYGEPGSWMLESFGRYMGSTAVYTYDGDTPDGIYVRTPDSTIGPETITIRVQQP